MEEILSVPIPARKIFWEDVCPAEKPQVVDHYVATVGVGTTSTNTDDISQSLRNNAEPFENMQRIIKCHKKLKDFVDMYNNMFEHLSFLTFIISVAMLADQYIYFNKILTPTFGTLVVRQYTET
ncbi:unnamed protein product [Acanthoscelides obtectus]|uniref:Uncharacterized protein n=1 Tax=Acanthoscelides obtectus TaxID=200917 RepID=A0A9P0M5D5_ACAOB|nr:unnamed protein product [Acanthoscelides obtectus]CAK1645025.1 hypothetical protein AOBTE_LOCUS13993 [Acanthoscelides obtectus]